MRALLAPLVLSVLACGDATRVRILSAGGPVNVTLPTLHSLDTVSGDAGELLGGARIRFDRVDELLDRAQNRELLVARARPVHAHYLVNQNQVAFATDFDTLVLFSTYAQLERAATAFAGLDVPIAATPVPVYYAPVVEGGVLPSTDVTSYFVGADFFVVEETGEDLAGLPLGANPGIVAHEYSHRIWYYELWRASLLEHLQDILDDPAQSASYNLLRAVNEGVADYFGAVISEDPRYLSETFDWREVEHRFLDGQPQLDSDWLGGRAPLLLGRYDPYPFGTVLASTLWRSRSDALDTALIATLRAVTPELPLAYQAGDFEAELLRQLDDATRIDACDHFEQSYSVIWDRFASVCP